MTEREELEKAHAFFAETGDLESAHHTIVCHGCGDYRIIRAAAGVDVVLAKGTEFKAEHRKCRKEKQP